MLHWKSRLAYAAVVVLGIVAAVGGDFGWSWH